MIWIIALGVAVLIAAPIAAADGLAWIGHSLWQGRRLDRSGGGR